MFCPECGKNINLNADFCSECGFKIEKQQVEKPKKFGNVTNEFVNQQQQVSQTTSQLLSEKLARNNPIKPLLNKTKEFVVRNQKQCIISVSCLVLLIAGLVIFNYLVGFARLSWNKEYSAQDLTIVTQTNIKLGINFSDEKNIDKIKYTTNCGEIKRDGLELVWNLTEDVGNCKITASYKLKKISKSYNVIPFDIINKELASDQDYEVEIDDEWNQKAKQYEQGTYDINSNNISIKITGTGDIDSTIAVINENTKISNKVGLINKLYTFYTQATMTEATITIPYTMEELAKYGLNEDNLSIYYYNVKENKYEKIETTIDKINKTITTTLKHFSHYVVGDLTLVKETPTTQILFILDNSWSLYTDEQYAEITGKENPGGLFGETELDGFDSTGKRFTVTSELVTKLEKSNYQMGLSEFRNDYANALSIGSEVGSIKSKLKNMYGKFITSQEGTNITNALTSGIEEFSKDSDYKYIVLLTDGQDDSLNSNSKKIINKAVDSNIRICTIGFGGGSYNAPLANISNGTGCKFYSSANASGLTELFDSIGTELNNDLVNIDDDNETDGILIADSGFIVNRDGFSFTNYGTNLSNGGHCYGMATFAQLYYKKVLPLKVGRITAGKNTSYAYDLTNTYFKDYTNLYDYTLKTNELKYTFGFEYFKEENPADLRVLENDSLVYNPIYRSAIERSGIYEYVEAVKTSLDKAEQIKEYGFNYSTYVDILLNEDIMQTSNVIENDDKQMLNAIYAGFIKQNTVSHYSSSLNFLLWMKSVLGTETIKYSGGPAFINILITRMKDKDAPVISVDFHAINAISLVQDIENPNLYYIGVYDNNYPGEKRYIDLECKKDTCLTKENDYYPNSGLPIRITPSLEYDLLYFNN